MVDGMTGEGVRVAVAHYCEGAGHATRMLAVTEALEAAGYTVTLAGGGPGTRFVEANGYEEFEPTTVDFVGDYQRAGGLGAVLRHSAPALVSRVREYRGWLTGTAPALLVTDDITAAIAAATVDQRFLYLSHDPHGFYAGSVERVGARVRNALARTAAERFLVPKVWRGGPTIPGATTIPPLAPRAADGGDATATAAAEVDVDVLVVPSAFSVDPDRLRRALEARGRSVTLVGGEDWTTKRSLQPYVAGADLVVCSGYSTVMEAAVAGTPCVIVPETSEQRGVGRAVAGRRGFYATESVEGVLALLGRTEAPEPRANGTADVVAAVEDLLEPAPAPARP